MLNETDLKIEKMKMLKRIGQAITEFIEKTSCDNVSVCATCCDSVVMTLDGKMHEGANINFTCECYNSKCDEAWVFDGNGNY